MMLKPSQILYLHGLGGSPRSSKALLITKHFAAKGIPSQIPDLAIPALAELSPQRVVEFVAGEIARLASKPLAVIASSFGAFLGVHALSKVPPQLRAQVQSLVLLAPVLDPWDRASKLLSSDIEERWRRDGFMPIEDLARSQKVPVHYQFIEELREITRLEIALVEPTLIVHGTRDETVSATQSESFAQQSPGVLLQLIDDDHRLLGQPDRLLSIIEGFILRNN